MCFETASFCNELCDDCAAEGSRFPPAVTELSQTVRKLTADLDLSVMLAT